MARRSFLLGMSAVVAGYIALRYGPSAVGALIAPGFSFAPLDDPAGFRKITAGQTSARLDPLIGVEPSARGQDAGQLAQVRIRLCELLFGDVPQGVVPVAAFSDYYCPFCRVLTQRLAALEDAQGLHIEWHEWPLLGPHSLLSAKGAIAAKQQGAYAAFHDRMMRGRFQATPEYLETLANGLGIDVERFVADVSSDRTAQTIAQSTALAQIFRFVGTPALVVGRTVVEGAISDSDLQRLIDLEREAGPVMACV